MIVKKYLPFRFSREGCIPNQILIQPCQWDAETCIRKLTETKKTAHYHLSVNGVVTALTPLSAAANQLGPTGTDPNPKINRLPEARKGILILVEIGTDKRTDEQREPLIRLLKGIQKEIYRIYGERFSFCHRTLSVDSNLFCKEELLERALFTPTREPRFRVQAGIYLRRRDAEAKIEQLTAAGIAGYIAEVTEE